MKANRAQKHIETKLLNRLLQTLLAVGAMASGRRRRVGRTVRRLLRRSATTRSVAGAGPLQAIGENTVVDRLADDALDVNGSSSRLGLSPTNRPSRAPPPKKQSKKREGEREKKKRKRPEESAIVCAEKKRAQQLETLLDELETQGIQTFTIWYTCSATDIDPFVSLWLH